MTGRKPRASELADQANPAREKPAEEAKRIARETMNTADTLDAAGWPTSRPRMRLVADLVPYAKNARTHSEDQVAQIVASIREFGWTAPVLTRSEDSSIIAGHGRILAAQKLGLVEVPTLEAEGWSDAQVRAYVIADNKLAENAGWDMRLLAAELRDLAEMGFDLDLTGFTADEIADMDPDRKPGLTDPDDAPDVQEKHVAKRGDVWLLGPHRVGCGDSTNPDDLARVMAEGKADGVWTDPPYNISYSGGARRTEEDKAKSRIANDSLPAEEFEEFLADALLATFGSMKPGAPIYVAHAHTEGAAFMRAFATAGFKLSSALIWAKDVLLLGRADYQWQHEPILYGWKPGAAHKWFGGRKQTTVLDLAAGSVFAMNEDGSLTVRVGQESLIVRGTEFTAEAVEPTVIRGIPKPKKSEGHPTMKPVALIERMLRNSTRQGDVILDPFGGSGSTLIACEMMERVARLNELEPRFVDVIVKRWQDYTGRVATLDGDGRTFAQIEQGGRSAA